MDDWPLDSMGTMHQVSESFEQTSSDEASEIHALANALKLSNGFSLLFARCNQADYRARLIASLKSDLPGLTVQEIPIFKPERHLLNALRPLITDPPPDALFVYGIEAWFTETEKPKSSPFIANLNAARNHFPGVTPCPLVFWVPEHILTAIARGAPDFFSVRSGIYSFEAAPEARVSRAESLTSTDFSAAAGLPFEEKLERIIILDRMLREYQELPDYQRDFAAEARIHSSLGDVHLVLGEYSVAEPHYKKALAIREKALGPEHKDTIASLNNLATAYHSQGEYARAEPLYQRALAIAEEFLATEQLYSATSIHNLAVLYSDQGNYTKAEPLYQQALVIAEKILGPEHPNTATGLNGLAELYIDQGEYSKVEPLLERAFSIREKALGLNHPDTAASLNNLGLLYNKQGGYAQAEPLLKQALEIWEKTLGTEHPDMASTLENYAVVLRATGRTDEADVVEGRAQRIRAIHTAKNVAS